MIGYVSFQFQSVFSAMNSPSKSSRRPEKSAFRTDSVSDFPNRRGRDMKKSLDPGWETRRWTYSVLSTYMQFSLLSRGKSFVSVAMGFIGQYYTTNSATASKNQGRRKNPPPLTERGIFPGRALLDDELETARLHI